LIVLVISEGIYIGDDTLIPISDEQAKLGQALTGAAGGLGAYVADIFGDLPKDLVGLLAADRVAVWRREHLAVIWHKAKERLRERGIEAPAVAPLKLLGPILSAAADENREELQDLWARLLAAALSPDRQARFRLAFISTLKQMDPFDAVVFSALVEAGGAKLSPSALEFIRARHSATYEDVDVSFRNLVRLDCVSRSGMSPDDPYLTSFGRMLAVSLY
jgi:Abortive infection alpha